MAAYEAWTVEWDMPTLLSDPFRRDVADGWGIAPSGKAYTNDGGAESDRDVHSGKGYISSDTVSALRSQIVDVGAADARLTVDTVLPVTPTGGSITRWILLRLADTGNYYAATLTTSTASAVTLALQKRVGGSLSTVASAVSAGTHTAGSAWRIVFDLVGDQLAAKAWQLTSAEPETWQITGTDTSLTSGTSAAVACRLEAGNSNGTVVISWDNLTITAPERWTDVTSYVDTGQGPFSTTSGDTAESSTDTGGTVLPLLNADQRFTPGNVNSPYCPNIRPGSRIRIRETAAGQTFGRFTGRVQYPEITAWTQSTGDQPRDQQIGIPVVDEAAWIAQGRKLVGTLAEHIVFHGGTALKAYWPLNEQGLPVETVETGKWTLDKTQITRAAAGYYPNDPGAPSVTFAGASPISGDDTPGIDFQPSRDMTAPIIVETLELVGYRDTPLALSTGQVCTLVGWLNPDPQLAPINSPNPFWISYRDANDAPLAGTLSAAVGVNLGQFYGSATHADWGASVTGPNVPSDLWIPVAVRFGFSPAVLELWVGSAVYTGTMIVTTPTPGLANHMRIGRSFDGSISHVQVYIGAESDWTHDDFLAQHQWGLYGGDRQSTGERIRTVLQFAGVDPADLGGIDNGASLMQKAALAGANPMDVIAGVVETEQGEFYADGDGKFQFADRIRLYNI